MLQAALYRFLARLFLARSNRFLHQSPLELTPLIRAAAQYANGTSKSERHFLDFIVDGQSLSGKRGRGLLPVAGLPTLQKAGSPA